jgi:hydrogenase expression/formation protein HypC
MCLTMPGRVLRLQGPMALVDTAGVTRWCNALMHPDLSVGDRVLLHAGLVLEVVSDEHASEIERAFEELDASSESAVTTSGADRGE